jgi:hypothetical protein
METTHRNLKGAARTFATRTEVDRQCREVTHLIEGCEVIRSATLYYVRLNTGGRETLMEWRKLTRKRATEAGMDSRLFERTA